MKFRETQTITRVSRIYQIVARRLALAALGFLRRLKTGRLIAIYSSPSSCRLRENSELSFLAEDMTSTLIISWDFNRGWEKSVPEGNKVSTQRLQVKERGWDPILARPRVSWQPLAGYSDKQPHCWGTASVFICDPSRVSAESLLKWPLGSHLSAISLLPSWSGLGRLLLSHHSQPARSATLALVEDLGLFWDIHSRHDPGRLPARCFPTAVGRTHMS